MKRNLLTLAAFGLLTVGAHATTNTDTLTISGKVEEKAEIKITPSEKATTLDVAASPISSHEDTVASVNETCNKKTGYKVIVKSTNAGTTSQAVLKGKNGESVNYTIKYGDALTLSQGSAVVTRNDKTGADGKAYQLNVIYTSDPGLAADTYQDVLTLTISTE